MEFMIFEPDGGPGSGKGGKGRMIPIPKPMMQLLKEYVDTVLKVFMSKSCKKQKSNYLFPHAGVRSIYCWPDRLGFQALLCF